MQATRVRSVRTGRILIRMVIGLLVVLAVVLAAGKMVSQEQQFARVQQQQADLLARESQLLERRAELQELQGMAGTPAYVEKIAREQLGMVRPNEIVFDRR